MVDTAISIPSPVAHLSRLDRVAVVLMAIGHEHAVEVLKQLRAEEVQKIGMAMTSPTVTALPFDVIHEVVVDFVRDLKGGSAGFSPNADEYVRAVMVQALGEDRASGMLDRIEMAKTTTGLEPLKQMEPRRVAELIRDEHPQIQAIILAHIGPDQAAAILAHSKENVRGDIMMRIAKLETVPPNALQELNDVMARKFNGSDQIKASNVGGVRVAASILNLCESGQDEAILEHIKLTSPILSEQIRELMFVFDNLLQLDDRALQRIIREVSQERLGIALRTCDEALVKKIMSNMSTRQAEIVQEDMRDRGPVRVAEVEAAQKEILSVVRRLADEGDIQLIVKPEAYV